jgi:uncharacterized protein (TIGR03437 family)
VSPGGPASVYGNNFGADMKAVTVTVGGKAAYVFAVVNAQVNIEIPIELAAGPTTITVSVGGATSAPFNLTLDAFSPVLATSGANNVNLYLADSFTPVPVVNPGNFVVGYAFGLGQTKPPLTTGQPSPAGALCATAPQLTIGDLPAQAICAAAPGFIATYQLNIRIPTNAKPGPQKLVLSIGGITSPAANVTVTSQGLVLSQTGLTFQAAGGGAGVPTKSLQVIGAPSC